MDFLSKVTGMDIAVFGPIGAVCVVGFLYAFYKCLQPDKQLSHEEVYAKHRPVARADVQKTIDEEFRDGADRVIVAEIKVPGISEVGIPEDWKSPNEFAKKMAMTEQEDQSIDQLEAEAGIPGLSINDVKIKDTGRKGPKKGTTQEYALGKDLEVDMSGDGYTDETRPTVKKAMSAMRKARGDENPDREEESSELQETKEIAIDQEGQVKTKTPKEAPVKKIAKKAVKKTKKKVAKKTAKKAVKKVAKKTKKKAVKKKTTKKKTTKKVAKKPVKKAIKKTTKKAAKKTTKKKTAKKVAKKRTTKKKS